MARKTLRSSAKSTLPGQDSGLRHFVPSHSGTEKEFELQGSILLESVDCDSLALEKELEWIFRRFGDPQNHL